LFSYKIAPVPSYTTQTNKGLKMFYIHALKGILPDVTQPKNAHV